MAGAAEPTEAVLAALREATTMNLPRKRAIALLQRGRGDVRWAANFYWEDVEAHPEDEEEAQSEDGEDSAGIGMPHFGDWASDGSRTPELLPAAGASIAGNAAGAGGTNAAGTNSGTVGASWPGAPSGGGHQPAPVDERTISAAKIRELEEVTKENLSHDQMRRLLAKSGGHVNIAVERYFNGFDAAQSDLRKRGLPTHTDRSPQRKRLSAEALKEQEAMYARVVNGEDDDIEIVGTKMDSALVTMPHARCSCPTMHFIKLPENEASEHVRNTNSKTCEKCYCWVCDVLAGECKEWSSHCMAFDRDSMWKKRRAERKSQTVEPVVATASAGGEADSGPGEPTSDRYHSALYQDEVAASKSIAAAGVDTTDELLVATFGDSLHQ